MLTGQYHPSGPVSLTTEQIAALHDKLRTMRHDVNGRLAKIVAAAELMRLRPDTASERFELLLNEPHKAAEAIAEFSRHFEALMGMRYE